MKTFLKKLGLLSLFSWFISVSSYATIYSGNCGYNNCDSLTWKLDSETGILEIFCKYPGHVARMNDYYYSWGYNRGVFDDNLSPWNNYNRVIQSITLSNISSIGSSAFYGCSGLTSVTIPENVTSIGYGAFCGCSSLTSITIPNSVTSIGDHAFSGCNLTFIKVENDNPIYDSRDNSNAIIVTASNNLIRGCKNTIIPNSVISIGDYSFSGCSGLTSINIPESVTSIWSNAFSGCSGLTSINIPNSVTRLSNRAFYGCQNLTSITIPNSVTSIGDEAFRGCYFAKNLCINKSTLSSSNNWGAALYEGEETSDGLLIKDNIIMRCRSRVTSITIPEGVTSIGNSAFSGCSSLISVTIPNSVTSIGNYAFRSCIGLISVTIPNSVTSIGSSAFSGCTGLTSITIPNSVTSIGEYAIPTTTMIFTSVEKSLLVLWNAGYNNIKEVNTGKNLNIPTLSLVKTTASSLILNMQNDYPKYYNCTVKESGTLITKEDGNMFLTGLNPNTYYNNISLALALEDVSYTTSPISARTETLTLITQQPKVISAGNVIVAAESNLDDEETNVGFEWRRYDWPDDFASNSGVAYLYDGTMEGYIRNLYTGAFWRYRPYYEANSGNRYYGDWVGIDPTNTNYFEPTARTYATITVTGNRAEVKGYAMRGTDRVTSQGFMYWKNTSSYSLRKKAPSIPSDAVTVEASGNVMTAVFEDLDYETEYCYVAFVKTEENETFFGEVQTFSTNVDPDGIEEVQSSESIVHSEEAVYDLSGRQVVNGQLSNGKLPRGINIIRYSDGTTRKVLMK